MKKEQQERIEESKKAFNDRVQKVNDHINAIDWTAIQGQIDTASDNVWNVEWKNVIREDTHSFDWDFLDQQLNFVVDQFTNAGEEINNILV